MKGLFFILFSLIGLSTYAASGPALETATPLAYKNNKQKKVKKNARLKKSKRALPRPDWKKIGIFLLLLFIGAALLTAIVTGLIFLIFSKFWIGFLVGLAAFLFFCFLYLLWMR